MNNTKLFGSTVLHVGLLVSTTLLLLYSAYTFQEVVPNPVKCNKEISDTDSYKALKILGADKKHLSDLAHSVESASKLTGISSVLLVSLMYTESNFNTRAVSSKNYKGLMQTPQATFIYPAVDILHGAKILEDKLKISKNDLYRAVSLYKGGDNPAARKYAKETLRLYASIQDKLI